MLRPLHLLIFAILFLATFTGLSFLENGQPSIMTSSVATPTPIVAVLQETTQEEIIAEDLSQAPESANSTTSNTISGQIPLLSLKVRVKPEFRDTYILNKAVATAVGGVDLEVGLPGQPLPEGGAAEIATQLCTTYDVCPTENFESPPDDYWSEAQITALWNVVQKIHKSREYMAFAIGDDVLEVSRAACYPDENNDPTCGDGTWGYYAGVNPTWGSISGARLVIATDAVPKEASNAKLEWLFAHEIGHGASGGSENGSTPQCLACNETAQALIACDTAVSSYSLNDDGLINDQEYVAEAIAYYMTDAEAVNSDYLGANGNMKVDFPCLYNTVKTGYFNDVEY